MLTERTRHILIGAVWHTAHHYVRPINLVVGCKIMCIVVNLIVVNLFPVCLWRARVYQQLVIYGSVDNYRRLGLRLGSYKNRFRVSVSSNSPRPLAEFCSWINNNNKTSICKVPVTWRESQQGRLTTSDESSVRAVREFKTATFSGDSWMQWQFQIAGCRLARCSTLLGHECPVAEFDSHPWHQVAAGGQAEQLSCWHGDDWDAHVVMYCVCT